MFRAGVAALGFFSAVALSPLLTGLCMATLSLRYRSVEVLLLGLLVDFLWLPDGSAFPLFTLLGIALVWGLEPLRREFLLP
jgi:hypothetical protein